MADFTTIFPIPIAVARGGDPVASLCAVKDALRSIPANGFPYGLIKYLTNANMPEVRADVSFNYHGRFVEKQGSSGVWRAVNKHDALHSTGDDWSPEESWMPSVLIEVSQLESPTRFMFEFDFDSSKLDALPANAWAQATITELENLCTVLSSGRVRGFTPSDFPNAETSHSENLID